MPRRVSYSGFAKKDYDTKTYTEVNKVTADKIKKMGKDAGRAELKKIDEAVAAIASSWASLDVDPTKETIEEGDKDFVGINLGGPNAVVFPSKFDAGAKIEAPDWLLIGAPEEMKAAADDDEDEKERRPMWGDGDNDPNEA